MRTSSLLLASLCLCFMGNVCATEDAVISAAIADAARPATDKQQDADRKPATVLAFIDVKPGDRVADLIPGGGYYTRLFAKIAGNTGHVYAAVPQELFAMRADADGAVKAIASASDYSNVSVLKHPVNDFDAPEKLDIVFTSMNYHDLHNSFMGPADLVKVNKSIFNALKPSGVYIVLDHAAAAGSALRDTDTLHRIDPETVKTEVLAAGFVLDAQSDALKNPDDAHTAKVFDPSLRGKTDKFIFKFRKPK